MSKPKDNATLQAHKKQALQCIDQYLDNLINSGDEKKRGKADKLSYWLKDYIRYLSYEPSFNPTSLRRYKRGEIIKVHLGYNIGSEEGGLHYAVVLDKCDSVHSPVLTIVPLTSLNPDDTSRALRKGEVFLGNELFNNLNSKITVHNKHLNEEILELKKCLSSIDVNGINTGEQIADIKDRLHKAARNQELLDKMRKEVFKMKKGSIALTNQITTISKIRIYDPRTNSDVLSNIKLSNEKLDDIDVNIIEQYVHKTS